MGMFMVACVDVNDFESFSMGVLCLSVVELVNGRD